MSQTVIFGLQNRETGSVHYEALPFWIKRVAL